MELENIVANTVYLKAREGGSDSSKGKSKKWKKILQFPHISQCIDIKNKIDVRYSYVVTQQPLGDYYFASFCEKKRPQYYPRLEISLEISKKYLTSSSIESGDNPGKTVIDVLNDDVIELVKTNYQVVVKIYLNLCFNHQKLFGRGPFWDFESSMYFHRYLQWKWLEALPVTYKTFRMYRVLGKGGFGEVCACQVRGTGKMYACKKLEKNELKKEGGVNGVLIEKQILQKINSRFVVNLAYAYEDQRCPSVVLTIMN
ncbi:G protein-coupled receptor kinase 2-like, partial [Ctenocephalides felis]|uniref:G protein-coupled receptor kinase 2-like n=1 Tax=Ctenocephalides felis TaxID=7515 RepID=UPI000E6E31EF